MKKSVLTLVLALIFACLYGQDKYDYVGDFYEGLAAVKLDGKLGYIDTTGKEIISFKYDNAGNFSEDGLAKVRLNGQWSYINKTGKEVIPPKYDFARDFSKGLALGRIERQTILYRQDRQTGRRLSVKKIRLKED